MIDPGYVRTMARYNAWQNAQLSEALDGVSLEVLRADHAAFFGSILGKLNHLLWADRVWMHRLAPDLVSAPDGSIAQSVDLCPTVGVWTAERFATDGRIRHWAEALHALDLTGEITIASRLAGGDAPARGVRDPYVQPPDPSPRAGARDDDALGPGSPGQRSVCHAQGE